MRIIPTVVLICECGQTLLLRVDSGFASYNHGSGGYPKCRNAGKTFIARAGWIDIEETLDAGIADSGKDIGMVVSSLRGGFRPEASDSSEGDQSRLADGVRSDSTEGEQGGGDSGRDDL